MALVTGATGGIGVAIARKLCSEGFQLVLSGRRAEVLEEVTGDLSGESETKPLSFVAELTDRDDVAAMVDQIIGRLGRIDVVVNNAGGWSGSHIGPFIEKNLDQLRAELENNLFSAVVVCHVVVPFMIEQQYGRIINVSSVAALNGLKGHSVYAAAKAGLIGLAKVLATELGEMGITANSVAPGPIATPRVQQSLAERKPGLLAMIEMTPNKRLGTPEEVADAVAFLASERSGHITGQTLGVSGGMVL